MRLPTTPYARPLGDGLTLRSIADDGDVDRIAEFDAHIHGQSTRAMWQVWMRQHPATQPEHWLWVEEDRTRRIVASLCLLPWRVHYEGIELRSGEMGVVGTLEEYRGRGLIRALVQRFDELLRAEGCLLSHIQGIPYFYRQFGYEYAVPLNTWWRLELHNLAGPPVGFSFRPAAERDLTLLMALFDEATGDLGFGALRDEHVWRYLLGPARGTDQAAETWIVARPDGTPAGYVRVLLQGFGEGLIVWEASRLPADAADAALHWLVELARARAKPYVRLDLPAAHPLVRLADGYDAHDGGSYAWQIRIPDAAALLRAVGPALERRVAESPFAGLTRDITLSLYQRAIVLRFVAGRLGAVEAAPRDVAGDLRLPPNLLAPLLLGWRTFDELRASAPDVSARQPMRPLVDVLFPRRPGILYSQY